MVTSLKDTESRSLQQLVSREVFLTWKFFLSISVVFILLRPSNSVRLLGVMVGSASNNVLPMLKDHDAASPSEELTPDPKETIPAERSPALPSGRSSTNSRQKDT
jgi:hypothetical protein